LLCNAQNDQDSLICPAREKKPDNFLPGERLLFSTLYLDMVSGIKKQKWGLKYVMHSPRGRLEKQKSGAQGLHFLFRLIRLDF
jgi:hypothetical protein